MTTKRKKQSICYLFILSGIILLSLLAMIKTIFVSFDIDEGYAIAQSYRMAKGDRMLAELWEPHQFSAYLSALFIKAYLSIFHTTESLVIYLRIAGTFIHLLVGWFLAATLKKHFPKSGILAVLFLHINFLAKWIAIPEFELMSYWILILTGCCMIRYYFTQKNPGYLILSGFLLILQMLNYPTMALLFPVYVIGMFFVNKRLSLKEILSFGGSFLFFGIAFLIYLFSYLKRAEFFQNLGYMMSDPSHQTRRFGERMGDFGLEFLADLLLMAAIFGLCFGISVLIGKLLSKKNPAYYTEINLLSLSFTIGIVGLCLAMGLFCLINDENQFFLQERYLYLTIGAIVLFAAGQKKKVQSDLPYNSASGQDSAMDARKLGFLFFILPSIGAFFASLLLTNMSVNVSYTRLFPAVLMFILYLGGNQELLTDSVNPLENPDDSSISGNLDDSAHCNRFGHSDKMNRVLFICCFAALLCSLLLCKLVLVRVTGCIGVTIRAPYTRIENGPLKGVRILSEYAPSYESDYKLLSEHTDETDRLFYFGCETILYLCSKAEPATASVQGTSVFNQTFLDYFTKHPEKFPTVIAVDKRYEEVEVYRYSYESDIIKNWILNLYPYTTIVEGEYMTLYLIK